VCIKFASDLGRHRCILGPCTSLPFGIRPEDICHCSGQQSNNTPSPAGLSLTELLAHWVVVRLHQLSLHICLLLDRAQEQLYAAPIWMHWL